MRKICTVALLLVFISLQAYAQPDRWQQRVKYTMNINMDVVSNQYKGRQTLEYTNNSPDALNKVFYHLYLNAFQPNSNMDNRSRQLGKTIINGNPDWDGRVKDRISKLKPDEIGYEKIISLKMNGVPQPYKYRETILEVNLTKPIAPRSKVIFEMEFEAQVPLQIRRTGRDNPNTKVRYSMSQWYPKLCEYDYEGWHPTPYVGREFYGVWGDYDVTINIDKEYKLGGTGILVNAADIGWGYDAPNTAFKKTSAAKRTWHFVAGNVHDFVWAADPDYVHKSIQLRKDLTVHVIYKVNPGEENKWEAILDMAKNAFPYIEKTFGEYPYKQYSFIRGGDGGMEYPMATLLADEDGAMHELMHSWYQGMLGSNESEHAWMDEGFTQWAGKRVWSVIGNEKGFAQEQHYKYYYYIVKSGYEEPLTTHADHFETNMACAFASYYKGCVFIEQLGYIVGAGVRDSILKEYYRLWRFKHPNPNDFIQVAEKVSGMKLDWYKEYWCNTTKTIDYKIDSLWEEGGETNIRLKRSGLVPMPIDLQLTFRDGTTAMHYIPMNLMFGEKPSEDQNQERVVHEEWKWTASAYIVRFKRKLTDITRVEIDPSKRMADIDQRNNVLDLKW